MAEVISNPPLDSSLLPFYQEWKGEDSSGLWDYLANTANYDLAAAFSKLFWPDFLEVDGCIFLAEQYPRLGVSPEEYNRLVRENPRSLEFTVNYVNIPYFFDDNGIRGFKLVDPETNQYGPEQAIFPRQLFVYLAKVLTVCWKHALQEAFPDKKFEFFYDVEEGLVAPKISFWQVLD